MILLKNKKAITLISLVITIVIIVILAAVAINIAVGNNGLFNKAKFAKQDYTNAADKERKDIDVLTNDIDSVAVGSRDTITLTTEELQNKINDEIVKITPTLKEELKTEMLAEMKSRYKSGNATFGKLNSSSGNSITVTFDTPMKNTNYSVTVTTTSGGSYWASISYYVGSKTTTGFTARAWNNGAGATTESVTANWVAVAND